MKYEDFAAGKYKIAFEPVAYFRYRGQNYAMTATEAAIYDKFIINNVGLGTGTSLKALLGPLTHSNLPRSAFLEYKDLGVPVYSPAESDYWDSYNYNTDSCIIRCMGIGTVGASETEDDPELDTGEDTAEYHTNTDSIPDLEDDGLLYQNFMNEVAEEFGVERCKSILANTLHGQTPTEDRMDLQTYLDGAYSGEYDKRFSVFANTEQIFGLAEALQRCDLSETEGKLVRAGLVNGDDKQEIRDKSNAVAGEIEHHNDLEDVGAVADDQLEI